MPRAPPATTPAGSWRWESLRADLDSWDAELATPAWAPRNIAIDACGETFRIGY